MLIAIGITVIVVLTLMTGYFVAQEFAYVSVDRGKLQQIAAQGDPAAERALKVTSRLSFTLSGAQFGITVTALLVGFLGEELVVNGLSEGYADSGPMARAAMSTPDRLHRMTDTPVTPELPAEKVALYNRHKVGRSLNADGLDRMLAVLEAETRLEDLEPALEALGHDVEVREMTSGLHAIQRSPEGLLGGADPRREGTVGTP